RAAGDCRARTGGGRARQPGGLRGLGRFRRGAALAGRGRRRRRLAAQDAAGQRRRGGDRRQAGRAVTARLIDGKAIAAAMRAALATRVAALPFRPGLAVVLVGDNPASAVYVRTKDRAAEAAGIAATTIRLPGGIAEADLLAEVARLNADLAVDGILVQLPLPAGLRAEAVIDLIDPAKDVDGFHPRNAGLLAVGRPALVPCTPLGVMKLLEAV